MEAVFNSRMTFLLKSLLAIKPLILCLEKHNCDADKKLENERKENIENKIKLFTEMHKLYPTDLAKRQAEITKIQNEFLNNVKNWTYVKEYNNCIKANCKNELIYFFKAHIPFFTKQIKINQKLLKNKNTTDDHKVYLNKYLKIDKENLKNIRKIDKWNEEEFNQQLYRFAAVTYPKFLFLI